MAKTGYQKCMLVMEMLGESGYAVQASREEIEKCIRKYVGVSPQVVKKYWKLLIEFNFITLNGDNIWFLNHQKSYEMI